MNPILLALPGNESLALRLSNLIDCPLGKSELRTFPDGETYVRIDSDI